MAPTLLWIGLGNMGRGMSKNLVEKGNLDGPLLLYNRSTQRTTDFSATLPTGKTEVITSLAEGVSRADVIFSCIANDEAVQETYKTLLEGDVKGKLFIESSTIHPETTEALAKEVLAKGAEFVAAPVFGAPAMADAGQLVGVLAGPAASVARAKPWFKGVTSNKEIDLSDQSYSKALTLKVLGNTFILNMAEQLAEAHVVAEKTGLGTEPIHQLVESIFGEPYASYSKRMLSGDYYKRDEPLFAVELARKDARHAMSLAKDAGVQLRNIEAADAHLAMAFDHVGSSADMAGIYGAVRKESGLKYENDA
ncbi:NAD binding domain of 6-phosphogluconate dehydrogenase-domain-containing protein [Fusarium tricinctum]|uniref:NAD binding domain of 6-phosphogluconate dehydrogenase-domain-containing protein n=1 Tax=Fusarium tricinctum TaxID=61284 RepID=A0A8K0RV50_9HYPO|nr:NAD binding domain of 6-phosphogluconate dehydrogenase-domain-containing protein [Fusarium tricinctum]